MDNQEGKKEYQCVGQSVDEQEMTDNKTLPIGQQQVRDVFPSASLLLECAKDEYTKERERMQFLDSKASFFMSAIILVGTIFVPFIPFDRVYGSIATGTEVQRAVTYIFGTLVLVSFVILVFAFRKLYNAYQIKEYARFNLENIMDMGNLTAEKNAMEKALCENYQWIIKTNINSNDNKAIMVASGIGGCAIGFFSLTISAIIMKIFIG